MDGGGSPDFPFYVLKNGRSSDTVENSSCLVNRKPVRESLEKFRQGCDAYNFNALGPSLNFHDGIGKQNDRFGQGSGDSPLGEDISDQETICPGLLDEVLFKRFAVPQELISIEGHFSGVALRLQGKDTFRTDENMVDISLSRVEIVYDEIPFGQTVKNCPERFFAGGFRALTPRTRYVRCPPLLQVLHCEEKRGSDNHSPNYAKGKARKIIHK